VGSEDPRKNLPALIKAFALVKQQMPGIKLLKVGAAQFSQEREKLQTLIAKLQLQHNVSLLNYVPDEDLPLFYNVADVFVMPSLYEGFGLPAAEAMACGTPLIYACIGPLPEVIGDGGMRVRPCDTYALAEAILALLKNEDEQLRLRQAGRQQAARFTLQRVASETREIYARMIIDT
jgi:glycosyltransferase involved in cell wall biosynthesis